MSSPSKVVPQKDQENRDEEENGMQPAYEQ